MRIAVEEGPGSKTATPHEVLSFKRCRAMQAEEATALSMTEKKSGEDAKRDVETIARQNLAAEIIQGCSGWESKENKNIWAHSVELQRKIAA